MNAALKTSEWFLIQLLGDLVISHSCCERYNSFDLKQTLHILDLAVHVGVNMC